jgi:hypothetical protein
MATLQESEINETIPYDVECPRCYGIMTLNSDYEFYSCDACDFILHVEKKK